MATQSFWGGVWSQYKRSIIGKGALLVFVIFFLVGLYAPFLASSRPLFVVYDGTWYFPLFRYLFHTGYYTKSLDIFYNILMFLLPLFLCAGWFLPRRRRQLAFIGVGLQMALFIGILLSTPNSPDSDAALNRKKQLALKEDPSLANSWSFLLEHEPPYKKLLRVLHYRQLKEQDRRVQQYAEPYSEQKKKVWLATQVRKERMRLVRDGLSEEQLPPKATMLAEVSAANPDLHFPIPTLWRVQQENLRKQAEGYRQTGNEQMLTFLEEREAWLEEEEKNLGFLVMPLLRPFHWEDDAGGEQSINRFLDWWELTRINRKDLAAGLLFGVRISLVVGVTAIALAILIGVPIGSLAGYYGGKWDIAVMRLIEIWESMPSFFMLLMVVAVTQSKSIFLVITVIGIFGWTGFARYIRGEFLKQRNLPYVEACRAMGFGDARIVFSHILPNAVPPLLTLLPFSVMGAITSEAGLSFLGLGEEGSCSWGVLMDEGRTAFPGESYLLWPAAIALTLLLISIALVGDALRDALDPKLRRS